MKTIIVVASIFGSSLFNGSNNYGSINMSEKLEEIITFEKGILPIEKNETEFVRVSFLINNEGLVEIKEMNYSDELIKDQLVDKLSKITVDERHDANKIYNYNFTFKKI